MTVAKQNDTQPQSTAWIAENPGDELTGVVIEITRGWSDVRTNGGRDMERGWYPLLTIDVGNGVTRDWHAFETVAEKRVLQKQPMPGEGITVTYLGVSDKEPPKGRSAPKLYKLVVHGRDPAREAREVYGQLDRGTTAPAVLPPEIPIQDDDLPPY